MTTSRIADPELLRRTAELAIEFLTSLDERPVNATATRAELLADLGGPLPRAGEAPSAVIEHLARAAEAGTMGIAGPRYFGFVIGGSLPAALAADWLTSTWDQNAAIYAAGPAASVVEEVVGEWLVALLGLPAGTSVGFTTGCQMAHVTCLAAARHAVLAKAGWDVEADGLVGAPPITVLVGSETHATIPTALQFLGLGRSRSTSVASDEQGRMRLDALEAALPAADVPLHRQPPGGQREHRLVRPHRRVDRAHPGALPARRGSTSMARSGCGPPRRPSVRTCWPATTAPTRGRPTATSG